MLARSIGANIKRHRGIPPTTHMKQIVIEFDNTKVNKPEWFALYPTVNRVIKETHTPPTPPKGMEGREVILLATHEGYNHYDCLQWDGTVTFGARALIKTQQGDSNAWSIHEFWQSKALYEAGTLVGWGPWTGDLRNARNEDDL
jgi:hypothetical protein